MGFVISTLKLLFFLLNSLIMLSCAINLGFGIFMLVSRNDVLGLGMREVAVALLGSGIGVLLVSVMGFCAGAGRRTVFMHFYSLCLMCLSVFEFGFGILVIIRHAKIEDYMGNSWDELNETERATLETTYNCCGYKTTLDRTSCSSAKAAGAASCMNQITGRQADMLTWLIVGLVGSAVLALVNYFVAYNLATQYTKARLRFKTEQRRQRTSEPQEHKNVESDTGAGIEQTTQKTAPLVKTMSVEKRDGDETGTSLRFLPDFLRPVPKPTVQTDRTTRSSGSQLTYQEIAAKYRASRPG